MSEGKFLHEVTRLSSTMQQAWPSTLVSVCIANPPARQLKVQGCLNYDSSEGYVSVFTQPVIIRISYEHQPKRRDRSVAVQGASVRLLKRSSQMISSNSGLVITHLLMFSRCCNYRSKDGWYANPSAQISAGHIAPTNVAS